MTDDAVQAAWRIVERDGNAFLVAGKLGADAVTVARAYLSKVEAGPASDEVVEAVAGAIGKYRLAKWGDKPGWHIYLAAEPYRADGRTLQGSEKEAQRECNRMNARSAISAYQKAMDGERVSVNRGTDGEKGDG